MTYVVMSGTRPYYSTLGTYRLKDGSHYQQWNPVGDGFSIGPPNVYDTIEAAKKARDQWLRDNPDDTQPSEAGGLHLAIVELPIRIREEQPHRDGSNADYYDPVLSRVQNT